MDSLRAARYPFTRDASQYAEKYSGGIEDLLSSPDYADARKRGLQRVMGAIDGHSIPDVSLIGGDDQEYRRLMEVLSYPYARMIVSVIDDRLLTKRYALAEAERFSYLLGGDRESVPAMTAELEVHARQDPDGTVEMHFADYLRYSYVMNAMEWKLINTDVRNGYVLLEPKKFNRLLQNAYRLKIERELPLSVPEALRKMLSRNAQHVENELNHLKVSLSPTHGEAVKDEYLPPCIKGIMRMAAAGQNLPHSARFALVSFLHALGMNYDQIVSVFAQSPDFDESISRYQIMHITGELNGTEGYTPPGCGSMKTDGICFDPDELCQQVNHPLSYYRKRSRGYAPRGPPKKEEKTDD